MDAVVQILIFLILARSFGEIAVRIGQPAAVGEVLAGVLIAASIPYVLEFVPEAAVMKDSTSIAVLAAVGMFFLILQAGVEMDPQELKEVKTDAVIVAIGGGVLPLVSGLLFGLWVLPESAHIQPQALLLGVTMAITAIPATTRILEELDLTHTRLGRTIIAAALIDDVIGIILLAILVAIIQYGTVPGIIDLIWLLFKVALFFGVTAFIGAHVYEWIRRAMKEMQAAALEFSALIVTALLYGIVAEMLGLHWIMGAFMAGLYFDKNRVGVTVYQELSVVFEVLVRGLLAPLFFLTIGLQVDIAVIFDSPAFVLALTLLALFGKFVGAGVPALIRGFKFREAGAIGSGMSAHGGVEVVVIGVVAEAGLFAHINGVDNEIDIFSALIVMVTLNTLIAPIAVRWFAKRTP
jgi:Kef-type K+ transport system membrane component KefB